MKPLPRSYHLSILITAIIQLIFIYIAILKHDIFYLAVAFVLNSNVYRVVNYSGDEHEES